MKVEIYNLIAVRNPPRQIRISNQFVWEIYKRASSFRYAG